MKIFILLSMIFCHIIDDYYLQGWLASAKQKSWWEKNAPQKLYQKDYLMALFMHSFSWTFMIMLIPGLYSILLGGIWYPALYIGNIIIHFIVDDLKANKKKINLIQDQSIHLLQVVITWLCYFYILKGAKCMKTIAEIKENPKLEILQTGIDGISGILHMTGLRHCTVVASWGGGWEHVSVCPSNRLPDWDEMCRIKDMFWNDDEVVMQLHPAKSNYVNLMPNCLHLWKPIGQEIPVPPTLYV